MFLFLSLLLLGFPPPGICLTAVDILEFLLEHLLSLGYPSPGLGLYFALETFNGQSAG